MSASQLFLEYMLRASKYALILLSLAIIIRCIRSMLREQYEPETWAYIRTGDGRFPVNHFLPRQGLHPFTGTLAANGTGTGAKTASITVVK